jgi:signal peptidase I
MQPTLEVGDSLVSARWAYADIPVLLRVFGTIGIDAFLDQPRRGDVILFRYPGPTAAYRSAVYIKRLIGLPGDTVQLRDGRLYVNGRMVDRTRVADGVGSPPGTRYVETLPEGRRHEILEVSDRSEFDNTRAFTVPAGQFFVMGDHRDNSMDSRSEGGWFVPRQGILGRADLITWSFEGGAALWEVWKWSSFRGDRFMKAIR